MTEMRAELDRADEIKLQFQTEREETHLKWNNDITKHKKEITDFKVKVRRITQ